jgi:mannose-6-phosphate isomerase
LLAVDLLENQVHRDAWGSLTAIPRLLGEQPDGEPRSELWMGAHPSASSSLTRNGATHTLLEVIESDPEAELGAAVVAAYGVRLPYLLKVLAAARPL